MKWDEGYMKAVLLNVFALLGFVASLAADTISDGGRAVLKGSLTNILAEGVVMRVDEVYNGSTGKVSEERKIVFIKGFPTDGAAEGQQVRPEVTRDGVFQKEDTTGALRTLESWKFVRLTDQGFPSDN